MPTSYSLLVMITCLSPVLSFPPPVELQRSQSTEELICLYFWEGHRYPVILSLLAVYHGIQLTYRTLRRKLKTLGLHRRNCLTRTSAQTIENIIMVRINTVPVST